MNFFKQIFKLNNSVFSEFYDAILKPLTDEERRLVVNFVAQAGRLFRRRREKGA